MNRKKWVMCPKCERKTKVQIYENTVLKNFPLFCPKCKQETTVDIIQQNLSIIKEPNAKT